MEKNMEEHLNTIHENEFAKTKRHHIEKLNRLKAKRKRDEDKDIGATDKWICNLSKHILTEAERTILAQGLTFTVTPKRIPHEDLILATELACERIPDRGQKASLRNEVAGIPKTTRLPPSNITKEEAEAVRTLSSNNNITILPADKGRTTVIMDTEQYEKQMNNMLMDNSTYEMLQKDPTEEKETKGPPKTTTKQQRQTKQTDKQ